MVRLFAGLAGLTALNVALLFESPMVTLDLLGIFTLLLYLCFIKIELLVADKEPHLFLTSFDSIRDYPSKPFQLGGQGCLRKANISDRTITLTIRVELTVRLQTEEK